MTRLRQVWRRLRALFRKNTLEDEMDEELRFHFEKQIEDNIRAGMSPQEARYAALRAFGNTTLVREMAREIWTWESLERLGQDLRYALRILSRTPGFTAMAVILVAIGIGPVVAIFSVVDQVLLPPLPFPDSARLSLIMQPN